MRCRVIESVQIGYFEILESTGIDSRKRFKVDIYVQCHTVKAGAASNSKAYAGKFRAIDIYAGRIATTGREDAEFCRKIDNALFQRCDQIAHADVGSANIDQRINH